MKEPSCRGREMYGKNVWSKNQPGLGGVLGKLPTLKLLWKRELSAVFGLAKC